MSKGFVFPDIDAIGIETLDAISVAHRFNKWMFETIESHCSGKILEIGSGIGNISKHFIEGNYDITMSDIRDNYCSALKESFPLHADRVHNLDLAHPEFESIYTEQLEKYDTVFALNVIEHIRDDRSAIANSKKLLRPGGRLIILVPAFNLLYNSFDEALEHYRRYTRKTLEGIMRPHMQVVTSHYFNAFGIAGWIVSGGILKKKAIPVGQMRFYDRLLPVAKCIDRLIFNAFGLSVICVSRKISD